MHPSLYVRVNKAAENAEAIVSMENRARYQAQSQDTRDGARAELPERAPLRLFVYANGED